jgi:hypothetical protein
MAVLVGFLAAEIAKRTPGFQVGTMLGPMWLV